MASSDTRVADAQRGNWADRFAPPALRPYLRMSRLDRPIGFWLLFWPCVFASTLASLAYDAPIDWRAIVLFLLGAIVMRGAGCTFNDIVDRNIDDKVARTRSRPIPSGQVSVRHAVLWMGLQALAGLAILVQFNLFTIVLGASSLVLVVIYPFMKRITYWPQLFLGLAFSWGALVGWSALTGSLAAAPILLYLGCIAWTIGYDTIYALQDIEDDALIGVKSTALLFGARARPLIGVFYVLALALWVAAAALAHAPALVYGLMLAPAGLLAWQVATLDRSDPEGCLVRFKANHFVGLGLGLAFGLGAVL